MLVLSNCSLTTVSAPSTTHPGVGLGGLLPAITPCNAIAALFGLAGGGGSARPQWVYALVAHRTGFNQQPETILPLSKPPSPTTSDCFAAVTPMGCHHGWPSGPWVHGRGGGNRQARRERAGREKWLSFKCESTQTCEKLKRPGCLVWRPERFANGGGPGAGGGSSCVRWWCRYRTQLPCLRTWPTTAGWEGE